MISTLSHKKTSQLSAFRHSNMGQRPAILKIIRCMTWETPGITKLPCRITGHQEVFSRDIGNCCAVLAPLSLAIAIDVEHFLVGGCLHLAAAGLSLERSLGSSAPQQEHNQL